MAVDDVHVKFGSSVVSNHSFNIRHFHFIRTRNEQWIRSQVKTVMAFNLKHAKLLMCYVILVTVVEWAITTSETIGPAETTKTAQPPLKTE